LVADNGLVMTAAGIVLIGIGSAIVAMLFIRRHAISTDAGVPPADSLVVDDDAADVAATAAVAGTAPRGIDVYAVDEPLSSALTLFKRAIDSIGARPRGIILRMGRVAAINNQGLRALSEIVKSFQREGTFVILCELHAQPRAAIWRSTFLAELGEENISESLTYAVALVWRRLEAANSDPTTDIAAEARRGGRRSSISYRRRHGLPFTGDSTAKRRL
jgi:MFS superfamily sulfate permease-like transporter